MLETVNHKPDQVNEYYEIRKRCILDLTINYHKHAERNCEVVYFSKSR